jgi:hypothetical protein
MKKTKEMISADDAWLNIDVDDSQIFNPMDYIFEEADNDVVIERLTCLMMNPDYFAFTCKYILNVDIHPFQNVILKELWGKKFPMLIGSRGMSKSFTMAIYCLLRCLLIPNRKVIVVGAAFRQSKVVFEYMETIWRNAPVLRDMCDTNSGPSRDVDRCVMRINGGTITCLPLGDGQKIRGQRAQDIIADEFASIPREIFENTVAGFGVVSQSPMEKVQRIAKRKRLKSLGIEYDKVEEDGHISNQIVLSGTAYYEFNHFSQEWKKYKSFIDTAGNIKELEELLKGPVHPAFDWRDYCVMRIPVTSLPEGFMDESQIARARATVHSGIFQMEYGSIFTSDSMGFFKRSLIEACTVSPSNIVKHNSGVALFEACLRGSKDKTYIYGVDPASEVDNFSIIVLEIHAEHRRIVHCWTSTRTRHKEQLKTGLIEENDFYSYCARKIRDLMKVFPCSEIALDAGGGGIPIIEALHDKDKIKDGEHPIWETIDPDKEKDSDHNAGLHIIKVCQFSRADWLRDANHGLRKDFEDKVLLFPYFDPVTLAIAAEKDGIDNRVYDTLEDCVMEIEALKDELSMIEITQTPSGREHWDTPSSKVGTGKKERLRKDRYSALLMANMSARQEKPFIPDASHYSVGGFAGEDSLYSGTSQDYIAPAWFTNPV